MFFKSTFPSYSLNTPIANIHIIATQPGDTHPVTWNTDPGQTPKLRSQGSTEGTASGLSWNSSKGLVGVKGFEYRVPIKVASSAEDAAVVLVADNDYLVVQLDSLGPNLDTATVTLQRVTAN
jgi:hypothetical protein